MNFAFLNRATPSFHAAALILGGAALVSKLLGLLRDRLLAARFGAGDELDVYFAAFQIPDVLYTLFLVGAASAAILPAFLEEERKSPEAAEAFIGNLLGIFSAGALIVVGLAIALAPWLVPFVAPGFSGAKLAAAVKLTRIVLGNTLFLGVAGILASVLQARHRFIAFALPPVVYNLGIILGILALSPHLGIEGVALGVLAGGIGQVLVELPVLSVMGFHPRLIVNTVSPAILRVIRTSVPRVLALALNQVNLVILSAIASIFAAGSLAAFKLAANLFYVPVGLFGVSYALALFPKLSDASLAREGQRFLDDFSLGIRTILFWTLPAVTLFVVLRAHIVRVILGSGVFDWENTRIVAAILAVMAVAIVSESLLPLILRAFYAIGKTREPLVWDLAGSGVTVALAIGLVLWFFASPATLGGLAEVLRIGDLPAPRILAVTLAFAVGSLVNTWLLFASLRRTVFRALGVTPSVLRLDVLASMLGAAVLAGLAAYGTLLPFPELVSTRTFFGIAAQGITAGLVGLTVYGVVLWSQDNPELRAILESIRRRLISPRKTPQVFEAEKLDGEGTK